MKCVSKYKNSTIGCYDNSNDIMWGLCSSIYGENTFSYLWNVFSYDEEYIKDVYHIQVLVDDIWITDDQLKKLY